MALRAVIFDYGMVLTGPQDPAAYAALLQITGLDRERFEKFYWADRHAYDEGRLTGLEFWRKLLKDAGLELGSAAAEELNRWDVRMWSTVNPAMVAWQQRLNEHGVKTAILSNMGDAIHGSIKREFDWIRNFDVLVWSYQLHIAKPDSAIYLHTLEQLGAKPEQTIFIDDKRVNIEAAQALGIRAFEFTTAEQLRADLIAAGFDAALPLP